MRLLDRYVLRSWLLIFVLTALGFPVVSITFPVTRMRTVVAGWSTTGGGGAGWVARGGV